MFGGEALQQLLERVRAVDGFDLALTAQGHRLQLPMLRRMTHDFGIGFGHGHDLRFLDLAIRQGDGDHGLQQQVAHLEGIAITVGDGPAQVTEIPLFAVVLGSARIPFASRSSPREAVIDVKGEQLHQLPAEGHAPHRVAKVIKSR